MFVQLLFAQLASTQNCLGKEEEVSGVKEKNACLQMPLPIFFPIIMATL